MAVKQSKTKVSNRAPIIHPGAHALVRELALTFPGVVEGFSYGTPAFKVGKVLIARLHQDGESLVLKVDPRVRESLIQSAPETLYLTDHYLNYPYVLVRLPGVQPALLRDWLEQAWRLVASPGAIAAYEQKSAER
jgi:hypothetical protein